MGNKDNETNLPGKAPGSWERRTVVHDRRVCEGTACEHLAYAGTVKDLPSRWVVRDIIAKEQ